MLRIRHDMIDPGPPVADPPIFDRLREGPLLSELRKEQRLDVMDRDHESPRMPRGAPIVRQMQNVVFAEDIGNGLLPQPSPEERQTDAAKAKMRPARKPRRGAGRDN